MHVTPNQKTRYLANLNEENLKKARKENVGARQTVKPILGRRTLNLRTRSLDTDDGAKNTKSDSIYNLESFSYQEIARLLKRHLNLLK